MNIVAIITLGLALIATVNGTPKSKDDCEEGYLVTDMGKGHDIMGRKISGCVCQFPFIYKGNISNDAIPTYTSSGVRSWCSCTVNYDSDKKWGYLGSCKKHICPTKTLPLYESEGNYMTDPMSMCHFPFKYNGMKFVAPISLDYPRMTNFWCATTSDYDADEKWGEVKGDHDCMPVDGKWNDWSEWMPCVVDCDHGSMQSIRTCDGPYDGGKPCVGEDIKKGYYEDDEKSDDTVSAMCAYTQWSWFSECSKTCGNGYEQRTRQRTHDSHADCKMSEIEERSCHNGVCDEEMKPCQTEEECTIQGSRPHVIMFLVDDMGWSDIYWNNPMHDIKMPYIKRLAESGKILNEAYSTHEGSSSRGALMSGQYSHKIGLSHMVMNGTRSECMKTGVTLLPQKLQEVGYQTHMVGKWDLGFCHKKCTPIGRGFDTFYGSFQDDVDHYTRWTHDEHNYAYDWHNTTSKDTATEGPDNNMGRHWSNDSNDLITARAVELIHEADPQMPMFLYYASPLMHMPMKVADHYLHDVPLNVGSEDRRKFIAMTRALDDGIKKVVEALKEKKMYHNSVIIFQSDNGGQMHYGCNIPLRGSKGSVFEGGIRVPSFIHSALMPKSEQGTKVDGMFFITDWHSTIMALAGYENNNNLDAVPAVDFLFHGKQSMRTEFVANFDMYYPHFMGKGAIRSGDYKLITGWPGNYDGYEGNGTLSYTRVYDFYGINGMRVTYEDMMRNPKMSMEKNVAYMNDIISKVQMYNIKKDPNEEHDISQSEPEMRDELLGKLTNESRDFFKFNKASEEEHMMSKSGIQDYSWVTGWCPDGPLSEQFLDQN